MRGISLLHALLASGWVVFSLPLALDSVRLDNRGDAGRGRRMFGSNSNTASSTARFRRGVSWCVGETTERSRLGDWRCREMTGIGMVDMGGGAWRKEGGGQGAREGKGWGEGDAEQRRPPVILRLRGSGPRKQGGGSKRGGGREVDSKVGSKSDDDIAGLLSRISVSVDKRKKATKASGRTGMGSTDGRNNEDGGDNENNNNKNNNNNNKKNKRNKAGMDMASAAGRGGDAGTGGEDARRGRGAKEVDGGGERGSETETARRGRRAPKVGTGSDSWRANSRGGSGRGLAHSRVFDSNQTAVTPTPIVYGKLRVHRSEVMSRRRTEDHAAADVAAAVATTDGTGGSASDGVWEVGGREEWIKEIVGKRCGVSEKGWLDDVIGKGKEKGKDKGKRGGEKRNGNGVDAKGGTGVGSQDIGHGRKSQGEMDALTGWRRIDCEEELLGGNQMEMNVSGGVGAMSPLVDGIETEMKGVKGEEGGKVWGVGEEFSGTRMWKRRGEGEGEGGREGEGGGGGEGEGEGGGEEEGEGEEGSGAHVKEEGEHGGGSGGDGWGEVESGSAEWLQCLLERDMLMSELGGVEERREWVRWLLENRKMVVDAGGRIVKQAFMWEWAKNDFDEWWRGTPDIVQIVARRIRLRSRPLRRFITRPLYCALSMILRPLKVVLRPLAASPLARNLGGECSRSSYRRRIMIVLFAYGAVHNARYYGMVWTIFLYNLWLTSVGYIHRFDQDPHLSSAVDEYAGRAFGHVRMGGGSLPHAAIAACRAALGVVHGWNGCKSGWAPQSMVNEGEGEEEEIKDDEVEDTDEL